MISLPALLPLAYRNRNSDSQSFPSEAISVFLRRVVTDLQHWLDSRWTAGLIPSRQGVNPELKLVCASGEEPGSEGPELVCPIQRKAQRDVAAVVAIGPKNDGSRYTASDRELAENLCQHMGSLLSHERIARDLLDEFETVERIKEESEVARGIYDRLDHLGLPRIPGLEFCGRCHRGGAFGGDFFELLPRGGHELFCAIGNVAARGTPGSLMLGTAVASIRALAGRHSPLDEITAELNRLLWELSPESFYTSSFCATIDPSERQMTYVNAGHEPALLLHGKSGRVERLESTGAVLGLARRSAYRQRTVAFDPGDLLLALSDGVGESMTEDELVRLLRDSEDLPVHDLTAQAVSGPDGDGIPDRTAVAVRSTEDIEDHLPLPACACAVAAA